MQVTRGNRQRWSRRRFVAARGSVTLEFALATFLLAMIFIGVGLVGTRTMTYDRDSRAIHTALDMAVELGTETSAPTQTDFNQIGMMVGEVSPYGANEPYEVIVTAVQYDSTNLLAKVVWRGKTGTSSSYVSRVSLSGTNVIVDGVSYPVTGTHTMFIAEVFRDHAGFLGTPDQTIYEDAIGYN